MHKVFLGIPLGNDGHVEDGPIGKLDLEAFRRFLGGYQIHQGDVHNGWLTAQLPFLTLRILQSLGALKDGTHLGMLPECGTQHDSLKEDLGGTCRTKPLAWWLEKTLQRVKALVPKLLLLPTPQVWPVGWPGTERKFGYIKCTI